MYVSKKYNILGIELKTLPESVKEIADYNIALLKEVVSEETTEYSFYTPSFKLETARSSIQFWERVKENSCI